MSADVAGLPWHGNSAECASIGWEGHTGYDSIPTIERVYGRTDSGAYECVWPGCSVTHRDAEKMWRHVHRAHGPNSLPPDDFDPGPWL